LNLYHLQIFCAVAENRSFAKAAEKINISQPAISQIIQKLEAYLDLRLIERKGKMFQLTSHGELLFEYGKRIFNMADEAENALKRFGTPRQRLFLGATSICGAHVLPAFISRFMEMNPYVQFYVSSTEHNHELIDKLVKNEVDLAVTYETLVLRDDIEVTRIIQDEFVLALPRSHPWASGQLVSEDEIVTLPFIIYNQGHIIRPIMESMLSGRSINVALQLNQLDAIKNAISHGIGVSMLPLSAIRWEVRHGLLAVANCPTFRVPKYIVCMYKKTNRLPGLLASALDCLRSRDWVSQLP